MKKSVLDEELSTKLRSEIDKLCLASGNKSILLCYK